MRIPSQLQPVTLALALTAAIKLPVAVAREEAPEPRLEAGANVPSLDLEGVVWIQGEAVTRLDEKGKLYLIECWATWCGPCIAAIPHVNSLSQKFDDQGLVVVGMNVWEDGLEKVRAFVGRKGDGMSYRVAYSGGRESAFVDQWLKPAGAHGIPFALLVRDGKLITTAHPSELTDGLIKSALADDFNAESFAAKQAEEKAAAEAVDAEIRMLVQAEKWKELEQFARTRLADEPGKQAVVLDLVAIHSGDWAALETLMDASEGQERDNLITRAAFMAPEAEGAKAFADKALRIFTEESLVGEGQPDRNFAFTASRARFLWISGDRDGAKALVGRLRQQLDDDEGAKARLSGMLGQIETQLSKGEFPAIRTLMR